MNLPILADVRRKLWKQGLAQDGPSDYSDATTEDKTLWDERLDQVRERLFGLIRPARTIRRIDVPIYDHQITLPREAESLLGIKLLKNDEVLSYPLFIYSRFHEFAEWGAWPYSKTMRPLSETAQTFLDPNAGFRLRAKATQSQGCFYTLTGGTDTSDVELFDSVQLNITNGATTTTRTWNSLPQIHKQETAVSVELYAVDSNNVETQIAIHAPSETLPAYQRYLVPDGNNSDFTGARILTRLCYVKITQDSEVVFPSSIGALKLGLKALNYEDNNDWDNANGLWQQAVGLIDQNKEMLEGEAEVPSIRSTPGYGCDGISNLDIIYPAGWSGSW